MNNVVILVKWYSSKQFNYLYMVYNIYNIFKLHRTIHYLCKIIILKRIINSKIFWLSKNFWIKIIYQRRSMSNVLQIPLATGSHIALTREASKPSSEKSTAEPFPFLKPSPSLINHSKISFDNHYIQHLILSITYQSHRHQSQDTMRI